MLLILDYPRIISITQVVGGGVTLIPCRLVDMLRLSSKLQAETHLSYTLFMLNQWHGRIV